MAAIFRSYAHKSTGYFIRQINIAVIGLICDGFLFGAITMPKSAHDINPPLLAALERQVGIWPLFVGGAFFVIYLNWMLFNLSARKTREQ